MKFSRARVLPIASLILMLHTPLLPQTAGSDPLALGAGDEAKGMQIKNVELIGGARVE